MPRGKKPRIWRKVGAVPGAGGTAPRFPARWGTMAPPEPFPQAQRQASARPGGGEAPATGGSGAGRGLWPPAGPDPGAALWQGRWPLPLQRWQRLHLFGREQETRPAFPRARGTLPCRPAGPGTATGQRPARRGRSARQWRVGRWPGGFGPRLVLIPAQRCGRGDGPCHCSGGSAFACSGGNRKRDPRFPRPRATVPCRPAGPGTAEGQRPTRRGRSARQWRVGRWPGALAPGWS